MDKQQISSAKSMSAKSVSSSAIRYLLPLRAENMTQSIIRLKRNELKIDPCLTPRVTESFVTVYCTL